MLTWEKSSVNRALKTIMIGVIALLSIFETDEALSGCAINISEIGFGNYNAFSMTSVDTTCFVTLSCTSDVPRATLSMGPSAVSNSFNPRQMRRPGGSDLLNYNIYVDAAKTSIFGSGKTGTSDIVLHRPPGPPAAWNRTVTIYGSIPPGQDVSVGSYSDTLTITIDW